MRIHFYENSLNYLPLFLFLSCICHTAIFRNFSLSSSNIVWFFSRRRFYYSKAYPLEPVTDHKPWIRDLIWQIRFFFPYHSGREAATNKEGEEGEEEEEAFGWRFSKGRQYVCHVLRYRLPPFRSAHPPPFPPVSSCTGLPPAMETDNC